MTDEEMTALTADTENKSEKIRRLYKAGISASKISDFLQIRYQQTYNVLLRAGLIVKPDERKIAELAQDAIMLSLDSNGAVRLPAPFLSEHGLTVGGALVCRSTPDGLVIMSRDRAVDYIREIAASRMPGEAALLEALLGSNTTMDDAAPPG